MSEFMYYWKTEDGIIITRAQFVTVPDEEWSEYWKK